MDKKLKHYSIPHLVHIEMSYLCNSKCRFCYNPKRENKINYHIIDKIVNSVYKSHIPHVYLIGGEPSLLDTKKLNQYINLLSENSSVTIVTNGLIYKKGLSKKLACIGIPLHGDEKTHDMITGVKGGYKRVVSAIKKYVKDGFDVRCIPVLMSINYDKIYEIIGLAKKLGMESIFVDRFEIGGLGSNESNKLKISLPQFKKALTQMIAARRDFNIPVGFGTAIPFCLDERLILENMWADCGVGVTFGAINPNGDFRICNQSGVIYGNVLKESIKKIWNKKTVDDFRDLKWITKLCKNCPFLYRGTFRDIETGIVLLHKAGRKDINISATIDEHNIDKLDEFLILHKKHQFQSVNFNLLLDTAERRIDAVYTEYATKRMLEYFEQAREVGLYEDRIMRKIRAISRGVLHPFDCRATGAQLSISPDGFMGICHEGVGYKNFFFGKVSRDFVFENNPIVQEWGRRSPLTMPQCFNCSSLGLCGGGCAYSAYLRHGTIWAIDDKFCKHSLSVLDWLIWDVYKIA